MSKLRFVFFSGEVIHKSSCSEDRTLDTMTQALTVHDGLKKLMYFI